MTPLYIAFCLNAISIKYEYRKELKDDRKKLYREHLIPQGKVEKKQGENEVGVILLNMGITSFI